MKKNIWNSKRRKQKENTKLIFVFFSVVCHKPINFRFRQTHEKKFLIIFSWNESHLILVYFYFPTKMKEKRERKSEKETEFEETNKQKNRKKREKKSRTNRQRTKDSNSYVLHFLHWQVQLKILNDLNDWIYFYIRNSCTTINEI